MVPFTGLWAMDSSPFDLGWRHNVSNVGHRHSDSFSCTDDASDYTSHCSMCSGSEHLSQIGGSCESIVGLQYEPSGSVIEAS